MRKAKVLILRTAGTNCDYETQYAFEICKAQADRLHIDTIIDSPKKIFQYDILALPGGFSYGDDIASGKILANEIKNRLGDEVQKFALSDKPIIGICNGFQVLVKMGLLPDPKAFEQLVSLSDNASNKFECRWIYLKAQQNDPKRKNNCIWTKNIPEIINLPIAHAEGNFIPRDKEILNMLKNNSQIVFKYCNKDGSLAEYPLNPNGSIENIAAICNQKGNILGLMPHPERYVFASQHPLKESIDGKYGWGKVIFQNAVDFVS
jgi:phosphoribosylformylglycinamidine synthase